MNSISSLPQSRSPLRDAPHPARRAFTPRERGVLVLVCEEGIASNRRLAEKLGVQVSTIKSHLESVFNKTGCSSKLQLLAWVTTEFKIVAPPRLQDARRRQARVRSWRNWRSLAALLVTLLLTPAITSATPVTVTGVFNAFDPAPQTVVNGLVDALVANP